MALTALRSKDFRRILRAVPEFVRLPATPMWIDFDPEADVLYRRFRRPQQATDSELRDDGIVVHRRGREVVGLTILEASAQRRR